MTGILNHIHSLERFIERGGARVVRAALPQWVHGRACRDLITVRGGLSPDEELPTLVHEITHWLVHRDARSGIECTVYEYEAEAVEALVMSQLGLSGPGPGVGEIAGEGPTDGLLSASIARVVFASRRIFGALGLAAAARALEPQTAIHVEAAAGEEIVLEYEHHRVGDFLRLA
jgi:hypothetical protein